MVYQHVFVSSFKALLILLFSTTLLYAQPNDSQIRKDLTSPGMISITFTKATGTKQWNSDLGAYEYVRGVEVRRESDIDGVTILVIGDAVYQQYGSKWKYWKFRVIDNRYDGIPNPTEEEITKIINSDRGKFFQGHYHSIVRLTEEPRLHDDPRWIWHSPTSVSFYMQASYDEVVSYTDIEKRIADYEVRLYRDDINNPWQSFLSSRRNVESLNKTSYTADEIRAMPSLQDIDQEKQAAASLNSLPKIVVPTFTSHLELAIYTHKILREGTPEECEAYLMQVLAPVYFVEGSTTRLTQSGADLINTTIEIAYQSKGTYADQYCTDPGVDSRRSSAKRTYILGCINNVITQIATDQFGGKYVEGVKTGMEWKIVELRVGTRQDQDAIDYINSFSDRSKLCPKD